MAEAGAWAADKAIELYEQKFGRGPSRSGEHTQDAASREPEAAPRNREVGGMAREMEMALNKR